MLKRDGLNFGFDLLVAGGRRYVSAESSLGVLTPDDNKLGGRLDPLLPGDAAVIELFVPAQAKGGRLDASARVIGTCFRSGMVGTSETEGRATTWSPYRGRLTKEIRSVASHRRRRPPALEHDSDVAATDGVSLTANHCGLTSGNARWWCELSIHNCGTWARSLNQNQSGAIFRAARADVDVALIELAQVPDPSSVTTRLGAHRCRPRRFASAYTIGRCEGDQLFDDDADHGRQLHS
jgi:hypothetical protein